MAGLLYEYARPALPATMMVSSALSCEPRLFRFWLSPHRLARSNIFQAARKLAEKQGREFGWSLQVVEGVAHSNAGMAASAAEWME